MNLIHKINAVGHVLNQADKAVSTFSYRSAIACIPKCGQCCLNPDIETTILEFLPAAYHIFIEDKYQNFIENIENKKDDICIFYNPLLTEGNCMNYKYRGLICRLFGYSKKTDKNGNHTLATCKPIKQSVDLEQIQNKLQYAPEMSEYYMRLYGIDPRMTIQYYPINQSIKKALEIILLHFQYTGKIA